MTGLNPQDTPLLSGDADRGESIVAGHIFCAECSYDLHGLRSDGRCPECGFAIDETIRRRRKDRTWLMRVHSGVLSLMVAHYALILSIVAFPLFPLGACMFALLQLGAAVEFEPKAVYKPGQPRRIAALFIGSAMILYGTALLFVVVSFRIACLILFLAIVSHFIGTIATWRVFVRTVNVFLSHAALQTACLTLLLLPIAAAASLILLVLIAGFAGTGQPVAADNIASIGIPLLAFLFILTLAIGLYPLHGALGAIAATPELTPLWTPPPSLETPADQDR